MEIILLVLFVWAVLRLRKAWREYQSHRAELVRACLHEWEYISAWGQGRVKEWVRICYGCKYQEPVRDMEVAERLTDEYQKGLRDG